MRRRFLSILLNSLFLVLCAFAPGGAAHASTIGLPPNNLGLVGYWSFNEGAGTIAHDLSDKGNNGTVNGATWTSGKFGDALSFNGSNSYIDVPNNSDQVNLPLTISAWVQSNALNQGDWIAMVSKYPSSAANGWNFDTSSGAYYFYYFVDSSDHLYTGSYGFSFGAASSNWSHLVAVVTNTGVTLYRDGVQVTLGSWTGVSGNATQTANLRIGQIADGTTSAFNGKIDEVRVYNRALSATEIAALYQSGAARMGVSQSPGTLSQGLVGWWTMDGKDTNWATGQEADESGHSNTGQLINMSTTSSPTIGKIGEALAFDGSSNYITTASNVSAITGTMPITLSMWVYFPTLSSAGGTLAIAGTSASPCGAFGLDYGVNGAGSVSVEYYGSHGERMPTNTVSAKKWYHLVGVYNGSGAISANTRFYINGVLQSPTNNADCTPSFVTSHAYINNDQNSERGPAAIIDDVRLYNRALSASEVKELYNLGAGTHANTSSQNLQNGSSLSQGLVGLWTFDGPTINWATGVVKDMSGNGNNGQVVNMSTTTSPVIGKLGQALNFQTNQYITVGDATSLKPSEITVAAWVYPNAYPDWASIAMKTSADSWSDGWGLGHQTGATNQISFWINAYSTDVTTATVSLNTWSFVVGTYDGSNIDIYVNGSLKGSYSYTGAINSSSAILYIGRGGGNGPYPWTGKLDDVRIYNRALSASEVKQLYLMGK